MENNHFKVKKIWMIDSLQEGDELDTSDYLVTTDKKLIQFEFIETEKPTRTKTEINPGVYTAKYSQGGLKLIETELSSDSLLESHGPTQEIVAKIDCFFRNLDKYRQYGIETPRRSMLLYGPAGSGKSSTISSAVKKYTANNRTAVLIWKTDVVEPDDIKFLIQDLEYINVDCLFFIAEDIGGVEAEDARINSKSSLLSLLDNQEKTFKIPTMMISTTNFPEMFLANIANRPQRFDDKIKVGYPDSAFRQALLKHMVGEQTTEDDLQEIGNKRYDSFTPAHIREAVIRSAIYEKTFKDVLTEMLKEIEHYNKAFSDKKDIGIGFS